jgi:hypothetical protein
LQRTSGKITIACNDSFYYSPELLLLDRGVFRGLASVDESQQVSENFLVDFVYIVRMTVDLEDLYEGITSSSENGFVDVELSVVDEELEVRELLVVEHRSDVGNDGLNRTWNWSLLRDDFSSFFDWRIRSRDGDVLDVESHRLVGVREVVDIS